MPTTRADAVVLRDAGPSAGSPSSERMAGVLARLACVAIAVTSVVGLWVPGVYGDRESLSTLLQAYDVTMLVLGVPVLTWATVAAGRGSTTGVLVRAGVLGAALYTYCYHLFATGFTSALLLHAVTFTLVLYAFVMALVAVDLRRVPVASALPRRVIAGCLALVGISLAGMWVVASVEAAASGRVPAGSALVEPASLVHLGVVLDLVLQVPLLLLAAALVWMRRPWGGVLASVAVVAGLLTQVEYLVSMPLQVLADVPGARWTDPFEPVIVLVFAVPAVLLLRSPREG